MLNFSYFQKKLGWTLLVVLSLGLQQEQQALAQLSVPIDLTQWETFGDVEIVNPGLANLSNNALLDDDLDLGIVDDEFNFSGEPAGPVDGYGDPPFLNDFLGVSLEELDGNTFALEGSALKSTLTVKAGETLVFDWNFYTNENSPQTFGPLDDSSFFVINGELLTLGTPNEALLPSSTFYRETGIMRRNYRFEQAGTYEVAFGVVDREDFITTSGLSIINATLQTPENPPTTVPEPNLLPSLMVVFGLVGISKGLKILKKS